MQAAKNSEAETLGAGFDFGLAEDTVGLFLGGTKGDGTLETQRQKQTS